MSPPSAEPSATGGAYQVLARKYRPQSFDDLIGQDPMVRTLRNAFAAGRIAHAFLLTGVRGVGKTTTARILARALNYQAAPDAESGPSIDMPAPGVHCEAIAASRHPDVLEMDAASRTGIGDIRDLIETVRYGPVQARYKVYIIDEVHMLSTQAFNGLLKTLEEPPPHVKFIFATTEIRRVPVTVLSRCQRFDLRRIDPELLQDHLQSIVAKEGADVEPAALALIARAAEGSVRDALSLLDQAIVQAGGARAGADDVRAMLGLADRTRTMALLDAVFRGDAGAALDEFRDQYDAGADPAVVVRDLLELTHWLTRLKVAGEAAAGRGAAGEADAAGARAMAEKLTIPGLSRVWGMLMKGLGEIQVAPQPAQAADMLLIRLAYAADLPTPDDLARRLQGEGPEPGGAAGPAQPEPAPGGRPGARAAAPAPAAALLQEHEARPADTPRAQAEPSAAYDPAPIPADPQAAPRDDGPADFDGVLALADAARDIRLKTELECYVHLVGFEPGRISFRPAPGAPADLASRLTRRLQDWTGRRWVVAVDSHAPGAPTRRAAREAETRAHPLVTAALETFPDAEIVAIRDLPAGGADRLDPDEGPDDFDDF